MLRGVNWIAVLIAVIAVEAFGFLWYGVIFNKAWMADMAAMGIKPDTPDPTTSMIEGAIVTLVMVLGIAWLVNRIGPHSIPAGMMLAFSAWIFFGLTTQALEYVYMGFEPELMAINGGYLLLSFLIAGAVLGGVKVAATANAARA